jgi:3-hydroxyisobutyrate dehydrogenase-like beta-hydroxyacid dehydrogenase
MVGLGTMGGAMAANLVDAGFNVFGFDIEPARCGEFERRGGSPVATLHEIHRSADIAITSLPSSDALQSAARDLARFPTREVPLTVIETSTLALADKQAAFDLLAGAGIELLDCPLSGTGAQAVTRDLVVLGSGEEDAFRRCDTVFRGISRAQHYLGEFGNGTRMKFVANLLVANHNAAAAEAMVLGMKAGFPAQTIYDVISGSAGTSRMFELRGPMMVAGDYDPATMKMDLWKKDLDLIGAFARQLGVEVPLFDASAELFDRGLAEGRGAQDTASVCAVLERMAGLVSEN